MRAIVLSIGDELTSGLTVNTNASWLAQQLTAIGVPSIAHVTVADLMEPIVAAIKQAAAQVDLLIISGGLGPTDDDLTRDALAAALGDPLVEDAAALAELTAWFAARNRPMSASNRVQARRPASATCITNTCGTAPGMAATIGNCRVFVMPGVPREMKEMFTRSVLPHLQAAAGSTVTLVTKIATFGSGESIIGERIKDLMTRGANPAVGTTVHDGIVSVRIYATGPRPDAEAMTARVRATVCERLGSLVFGEGEATLEAAVGGLLAAQKKTVATAESCTGGLVAQMLTSVPGSSAYVTRGYVTYANEAKIDDLGVPADLIAAHGAVSEPVARAMAEGARRKARADFALATTGIAGPAGGTADKPVGTVWIALATPAGIEARRYNLPGDRHAVRLRAAQMSLALLRWHLLGDRPPG